MNKNTKRNIKTRKSFKTATHTQQQYSTFHKTMHTYTKHKTIVYEVPQNNSVYTYAHVRTHIPTTTHTIVIFSFGSQVSVFSTCKQTNFCLFF